MFSIDRFISSLLPNIERNTMVDDANITLKELEKFTLPPFQAADRDTKGVKFTSEEYKQFVDQFKIVSRSNKPNLIPVFYEALKNLQSNLKMGLDSIEDLFLDDAEVAGLSYKKGNLLQLLEAASFMTKYARKWLHYIYICETRLHPDGGITNIKDNISPVEVEWLEANFISFAQLVTSKIGDEPNMVTKALSTVPDVIITPENTKTMPALFGDKLDPFRIRNLSVAWLNPVFHYKMHRLVRETKRYQQAQDELRALQLRKLNLELLMERKPDARLQNQLEITESRIQDLCYEINKVETEHA